VSELLSPTPREAGIHAAKLDQRVAMLILALGALASAAIVATFSTAAETLASEPRRVLTLLLLTLVLQMFSLRVYGYGSVSVSAIGVLVTVFVLDAPTAMLVAALAAIAQWLRMRPELYKAAFDVSNYTSRRAPPPLSSAPSEAHAQSLRRSPV
jgi:hypothetical protein